MICFWSVMLIATIGIHAYRLRQAQKGQIILDWLGIRFVRPSGGMDTVLVSDIKQAKYSWMSGQLNVIGWDNEKLLTIPQWQVGREWSVIDLARKINQLTVSRRDL